MSPPARVAVTFLLVILAVVLWAAAGLPSWYDRGYLGNVERYLAAFFFLVALGVNVLGLRGASASHHLPHHSRPHSPTDIGTSSHSGKR